MKLTAFLFVIDLAMGPAFQQAANAQQAAQRDTAKVAPATDKSHLVVGVTANSDMNYYGRVDSQVIRGLYPFIGFDLKDGLYANSTFVFINNGAESEYAATLLEAGYNFHNKGNTLAGNLSASKFMYQGNTGLLQSVIKEDVAASITQLNKIVNLSLGADVKFSNFADPGAQAGLDHTIKFVHPFGRQDALVVDPSAYVYAGTQQFTQTFYQQEMFLIFPAGEQALTTNGQRFDVLAYEFSLPVVYVNKKFTVLIDPAYVLPENVIPDASAEGLSVIGKDLFYVSGTVKFSL